MDVIPMTARTNTPPREAFPIGVCLFTAAYMLAAVAGAVVRGNKEFLFYIVVMLVLISVMTLVHFRVRLSSLALWGMSIWGLSHMAGGLVAVPESWPINGDIRVLYSWWLIPDRLKYDQIVHAWGFGMTTIVCWEGLCAAIAGFTGRTKDSIPPTVGLLILVAAAGMGFGALNEIIEFVATLLVPKTNVGGYENTGWDLVSNLVGVAVAALYLRVRRAG